MTPEEQGARLLELIESKGMNVYKLAYAAGVSQPSLSQICKGKRTVDRLGFATAYKLANALGITLDELAATVLDEA